MTTDGLKSGLMALTYEYVYVRTAVKILLQTIEVFELLIT